MSDGVGEKQRGFLECRSTVFGFYLSSLDHGTYFQRLSVVCLVSLLQGKADVGFAEETIMVFI